MRGARLVVLLMAPGLSGCVEWQSAMHAQGHAQQLASMISIFSIVLGVIWAAVTTCLVIALLRKRAASDDLQSVPMDPRLEKRSLRIVIALAMITGVIVLALTGVSYTGQRDLFASKPNDLVIKVTGHQWWWEARYEDDLVPSNIFTTANEIHIPVGVPIKVQLESQDVIHSFWIPSLNGKQDLIPGQPNETELLAIRPGIYRGQCAEFCGLQHAHMSIFVIADDLADFARWRNEQRTSAAEPMSPEQQKGRDVFMSHACVMCHAIGGTQAGGRAGPDLTHIGSRRMLAAGEFPLNRGTLEAWIADPQGLKPGSQMPAVPLEADELGAVSAYLESLR
jgi:cytochrome c oxidase subunit II